MSDHRIARRTAGCAWVASRCSALPHRATTAEQILRNTRYLDLANHASERARHRLLDSNVINEQGDGRERTRGQAILSADRLFATFRTGRHACAGPSTTVSAQLG